MHENDSFYSSGPSPLPRFCIDPLRKWASLTTGNLTSPIGNNDDKDRGVEGECFRGVERGWKFSGESES